MAIADMWGAVARVLTFAAGALIGIILLKFITFNFLADEKYHPVDYFSNVMRTKPPCFMLVVVALAGSAVGSIMSGQLGLLQETLPEVIIAVDLLGMVIFATVFRHFSAAAALVAVLLYEISSVANVIAVMVVTPPEEPGWVYGSAFLVLNFVWVAWLRVAIQRYTGRDGNESPLPHGADTLPRLWAKAALYGIPMLLVSTNVLYFIAYLAKVGSYGWASALSLYTVSGVLILGCCHSYRSGTELEEG